MPDEYDHLRESAREETGECPFCAPHPRHTDLVCGRIIEGAGLNDAFVCRCATGSAVIEEITEEIKAGNAAIFTRNDLEGLLRWINDNTDIFDPIMVEGVLGIDDGHPECHIPHSSARLKLEEKDIKQYAAAFAQTIGKE